MDWAGPRGVFYTLDGESVHHVDTLIDLLDLLGRPHRVVLEPAFESFDPVRRELFVRRARNDGHDARVISDRQTARWRRDLSWEKNDQNDTRVIWQLAHSGKHLSPVHSAEEVSADWRKRQAHANLAAVQSRYQHRDLEAVAALQLVLGQPDQLPEPVRQVLCDKAGKRYANWTSAIWQAAQLANDRREFERALGLYQNGYSSMLRSQVHHHGFWGGMGKAESPRGMRGRGVSWSQFRRVLRWCFHQVQASQDPRRG